MYEALQTEKINPFGNAKNATNPEKMLEIS
jgi:hypothetical protein